MEKSKFNTNLMRIGELRYYSKENKGVEVSAPLSYGMFMFLGGQWVNIFDVADDSSIFVRSRCYGNITADGFEYGSKLQLVSDADKEKTGPCWILGDTSFAKVIGREEVRLGEIEDYILNSSDYYKDRMEIARQRLHLLDSPIKMLGIIRRDKKDSEKMDEFFAERSKAVQKVKKG